jgi:hypothetical protein
VRLDPKRAEALRKEDRPFIPNASFDDSPKEKTS